MQTRVCNNNGVCSCRKYDAENFLVCCSSISRSLEEPHLSEVILETVNKAPIILMVNNAKYFYSIFDATNKFVIGIKYMYNYCTLYL